MRSLKTIQFQTTMSASDSNNAASDNPTTLIIQSRIATTIQEKTNLNN